MPPKGWKGMKQETGIQQGRPVLGLTKKVSITLPLDCWHWLDDCIEYGHAKSMSELLRNIISESYGGNKQ